MYVREVVQVGFDVSVVTVNVATGLRMWRDEAENGMETEILWCSIIMKHAWKRILTPSAQLQL